GEHSRSFAALAGGEFLEPRGAFLCRIALGQRPRDAIQSTLRPWQRFVEHGNRRARATASASRFDLLMRPLMFNSELLNDHRAGHSEFQIEQFILTRGNWSPFGRYKQCLREIDSRRRAIQDMHLELAQLQLDLDRRALWVRWFR